MSTNTTDEVPCREGRKAQRQLYEKAHQLFQDRLEVFIDKVEYPLPYDLCDQIRTVPWNMPCMDLSISNDLREAINQLHSWYHSLVDWHLWIDVLKKFEGNDAWYIRKRYIEPLAYFCMMQPSSTRERFGSIATNALHQANLALLNDYKDQLDQDKRGYLSRSQREKQIRCLGKSWECCTGFQQALQRLDSKDFSRASYNFRNLASHGIAPRFEQGETNFVKRSIEPWSELVEQADGTYQLVSHPIKKAVCYGVGGTRPLSFQAAYDACAKEYLNALATFHSYQALVRELIQALATGYEISN
ncbi:hypothetical protein [Stutzerimonas stutzeri]|uniref:hypothetical protein n=1 Tax=Stutzerimonas stutzeri TaxID=316 RepID=UPI0020B2081F|nr:hypothetical protein [Stutzerimonas stutzeri]MCP3433772.1 hypothetical protein [Stutzerimonas stutzeri]